MRRSTGFVRFCVVDVSGRAARACWACLRVALGSFYFLFTPLCFHGPSRALPKRCGCCGRVDVSLKAGLKRCNCPRCTITIDRQVNGARNNLLAALGKATGIGWDAQSL